MHVRRCRTSANVSSDAGERTNAATSQPFASRHRTRGAPTKPPAPRHGHAHDHMTLGDGIGTMNRPPRRRLFGLLRHDFVSEVPREQQDIVRHRLEVFRRIDPDLRPRHVSWPCLRGCSPPRSRARPPPTPMTLNSRSCLSRRRRTPPGVDRTPCAREAGRELESESVYARGERRIGLGIVDAMPPPLPSSRTRRHSAVRVPQPSPGWSRRECSPVRRR